MPSDLPEQRSRFANRLSLIVSSVAAAVLFFERVLPYFAACAVRWPVLVTDHSGSGRDTD